MLSIEEHHHLKDFRFMDFNWDLFKGVISLKTSLLQISPLKVVFESKLIFESECFVRVSALLSGLIVKNQEETGIDIVLDRYIFTS